MARRGGILILVFIVVVLVAMAIDLALPGYLGLPLSWKLCSLFLVLILGIAYIAYMLERSARKRAGDRSEE